MSMSPRWVVLVGCAACAGDIDPATWVHKEPPTASLRAPVIAPVGLPVTFDASASRAQNGDALLYAFTFGAGEAPLESNDPVVTHVFRRAGLYTVGVRVFDPDGGEAAAEHDVAVRDDYPTYPDFCSLDAPCVVGDECERGVCYLTGGALD